MKKIFIILIIIAVALLAFWYLGNNNQPSDSSLSTTVSAPQSTDAKYIYSLLQSMKQVKLDNSIFSNPVFTSLKDNTIMLSPQDSGRNNPFAPIGTEGTFTPKSTTTRTR